MLSQAGDGWICMGIRHWSGPTKTLGSPKDPNPEQRQCAPGKMEVCGARKRRKTEVTERVMNG